MLKGLLLSAALFLIPTITMAEQAPIPKPERSLPMKFELMPGGVVRAVGVIGFDTPTLLRQFDREHNLKGRLVVLDSNGGYTPQAMAMGRFLRKKRVTTTVGVVHSDGSILNAGDCASICPFLFLGGVKRYAELGNRFFVHQLWIPNETGKPSESYSAEEVFRIQRHLGTMCAYVTEMGGSAAFMKVALSERASKLKEVPLEEMKKYRWFTK